MRASTIVVGLAAAQIVAGPGSVQAQQGQGPRTEAFARAQAERNRAERALREAETGEPIALIHDYVKAIVGPVPESLGVAPFYQKYVDALGIPVLASTKVPDIALLVARDIVNAMLAYRPDLRASMIERNWRTGVIAETEMTMDIPEYADRKRPGAPEGEPITQADRDYHANRSRGLGGNPTTGAEENLLGYPGTRYFGEHIFVHEFSHAIHRAIREVDADMAREIDAAYEQAMAAGKYVHTDGRRHYATTNSSEYWAEGVQWWFFSNYGECFRGDVQVDSPEEFAAYDPVLNELIGRVFRTHHIPMDVFHGKRVRPVTCGADRGSSGEYGAPDRNSLQGVGEERIGFSRLITAIDPERIVRIQEAYGREPPPIALAHEGIEDSFLEKASSILYCHEGAWIVIPGMD